MDVSIIIVNWNTCGITCDCIESIYNNTENIEFEIILVDNASEDDSVETVKRRFPEVILIENKRNEGFAAANNKGMAMAKGRYFLLLNSDTIIIENVIEKCIFFAEGKDDVGMIGCRVLNKDKTLQPTCFMYPSLLNMLISSLYLNKLFSKRKFWGRERYTWWDRSDEMIVQTVTGCFMFVKKDVVDSIGVMDDDFFFYAEETDWCLRAERAGYMNYFTPTGEIIHLGGVSSSKVKPEMILQLSSGTLQFIKKHHGFFYYVIACILNSFWFLVRAPYWLYKSFMSKGNKNNSKIIFWTYIKGALKSLLGYKSLKMKT